MGAFVLDASVALQWFLEDEEDRAYALSVLQHITDEYRPIVPWLWYYEIGNSVLMQVRRKRISLDQAGNFLQLIDQMLIDVDRPDSSRVLRLPALAVVHNLTAYDASYLELAIRLELPLATKDKKLAQAAMACRVDILTV